MRRSFCMFLIFILTLMLLSLDFSFAAGEEAGMPVPGDDHPSEEIVRAGENRGRFSVMTEKQRMTYIVPGDEYGENSKSSGRQRDLPCDAVGITDKGYSKTTRNAYGEPSPVHPSGYYGMLMWVTQDDEEARPFMMEALRTLSVPEN